MCDLYFGSFVLRSKVSYTPLVHTDFFELVKELVTTRSSLFPFILLVIVCEDVIKKASSVEGF